jgi:phosphoribosylanthranilate isomerase
MRTRVKICGVTRPEDAARAAALGADMIGMVFWPRSPRAVTPARALEIAAAIPAGVQRAGVFVDAETLEIADVAAAVPLDIVQVHGGGLVDADAVRPAVIFMLTTLETEASVATAGALPSQVFPLVDAADPVRRGGTGEPADWPRAAQLAATRPIVLAGGLTADNVGDAIRRVRPWAVDVSSGVEERPGLKSAARLEAFLAAVAAADGVRA